MRADCGSYIVTTYRQTEATYGGEIEKKERKRKERKQKKEKDKIKYVIHKTMKQFLL